MAFRPYILQIRLLYRNNSLFTRASTTTTKWQVASSKWQVANSHIAVGFLLRRYVTYMFRCEITGPCVCQPIGKVYCPAFYFDYYCKVITSLISGTNRLHLSSNNSHIFTMLESDSDDSIEIAAAVIVLCGTKRKKRHIM